MGSFSSARCIWMVLKLLQCSDLLQAAVLVKRTKTILISVNVTEYDWHILSSNKSIACNLAFSSGAKALKTTASKRNGSAYVHQLDSSLPNPSPEKIFLEAAWIYPTCPLETCHQCQGEDLRSSKSNSLEASRPKMASKG